MLSGMSEVQVASAVTQEKIKKKRRTLQEREMATMQDLKRIQNAQAKELKDSLNDAAQECGNLVSRMGLKPQTKLVSDAQGLLKRASDEIKLEVTQ